MFSLVVVYSLDMNFCSSFCQPQRLPSVSGSEVFRSLNQLFEFFPLHYTKSNFFLEVLSSVVCPSSSHALSLDFLFVYFFLIYTDISVSPDPLHFLLPECHLLLLFLDFLLSSLVLPFFFRTIL